MGSLTIRRTQRFNLTGRTDPSPPSDSTTYIQTDRRREEHRSSAGYGWRRRGRTTYRLGPLVALITRCDLKQVFLLNLEDHEYTSSPLRIYANREEWLAEAAASGQVFKQKEPSVLVETETVDTGERKELFGRTARHVITTRRVSPLHGAKPEQVTVNDG